MRRATGEKSELVLRPRPHTTLHHGHTRRRAAYTRGEVTTVRDRQTASRGQTDNDVVGRHGRTETVALNTLELRRPAGRSVRVQNPFNALHLL